MDENDPLSEQNKIPLGHIVPMAPFTPKSTSIVTLLCTLDI